MNKKHTVDYLFSLLDENGSAVELDADGQIPVHLTSDMIPLRDWAIRNGISPDTARQKALRGVLKTARKVGRDWMISASEINVDHRARISAHDQLAIEGPVWVSKVLNYLLALDGTTLPESWARDNSHQEYCRQVFVNLRNQMMGNEEVLFNILLDKMEIQPNAHIYYVSHDEILDNIDDEAWHTSSKDSTLQSGITIDFNDYLKLLKNIIHDMMSHNIDIKIQNDQQELIMPWYHSITWRQSSEDGIYFVPSDFFRTIFLGINNID
ncbi:MAG: hypothetical protein K6G05_02340 [Lachnospiraceae bacterium]|nr:hypothetical protein [Lachnospiraceae bacterium]